MELFVVGSMKVTVTIDDQIWSLDYCGCPKSIPYMALNRFPFPTLGESYSPRHVYEWGKFEVDISLPVRHVH